MKTEPQGTLKLVEAKANPTKTAVYLVLTLEDDTGQRWNCTARSFIFDLNREDSDRGRELKELFNDQQVLREWPPLISVEADIVDMPLHGQIHKISRGYFVKKGDLYMGKDGSWTEYEEGAAHYSFENASAVAQGLIDGGKL